MKIVWVLALAALAAPAAARAAPVPLSADRSPADVDSAFGSGAFGRWTSDARGLPAFRYLIDQQVFPPARQPELKGATEAQHQLGNDHIVAAAFNHGYTQLWSQDRLPQWANRFDPENGHYGGGFGYLNVAGRVVSTLYLDRPRGSRSERLFGTGYYQRRLRAAGLEVRERVYAPFGDDPLLLHDVTIRNPTRKPQRASWFEYWDVNPYLEADDRSRAVGTARWTQSHRTLSVPQASGDLGDERPLSIFAAALRAPAGGHETSAARFFGSGTRAAPAAVAADRLSGSTARDGGTLFAFRAPLRLRPGQSITLRYAYGMAHPRQILPLVRKYRGARNPFATMRSRWAAWLPRADFGPGRTWAARELQWDAYLLRTAAVYEEECGHHTITQGGYYQYSAGANLGSRSWLHYLLPMVYADPALAREILRFSVVVQSAGGGPPLRAERAVHELQGARHLGRPRLLAAASGRRVRPRHTRPALLRGAAPVCRLAREGHRMGAREDRVPAPGVAARPARRLPRRDQRGLVRLLRVAPAHVGVDARAGPARLRLPAARRPRRSARRPRASRDGCGPAGES